MAERYDERMDMILGSLFWDNFQTELINIVHFDQMPQDSSNPMEPMANFKIEIQESDHSSSNSNKSEYKEEAKDGVIEINGGGMIDLKQLV